MSKMAMELPGNGKTPPRAAVSHLSGDLDTQARLEVEGHGYAQNCAYPEALLCERWASAMEGAHGS